MPLINTPVHQPINLQASSRLFFIPIEVRREIYLRLVNKAGVHIICTDAGEFRLSPCLDPDENDRNIGAERSPNSQGGFLNTAEILPTTYSGRQELWGRRLASSWGTHWECEELLIRKGPGGGRICKTPWQTSEALLSTCQRMRLEVMILMAESACFHVSDLGTIAAFAMSANPPAGPPSSTLLAFPVLVLPYIKSLDIVMKLPLSTFYSSDNPDTANTGSLTTVTSGRESWSSVPKHITSLASLRRLRIWLDHDNTGSWSVINERALLSQLEPLTSNRSLHISFDLPKLHPKLEDPRRHFVEDGGTDASFGSLVTLNIHRRLRQRWHGVKDSSGVYKETWAPDFPISLEYPLLQHLAPEEIEKQEGIQWKSDLDVNDQTAETLPFINFR